MNPNQPHTLRPEYFDEVYRANNDPWNFETSPYEQGKYADTMAALPPERQYESAFEVGCSLGVLTEQLATRCRHLLAIDVAQAPLERARQRCAHLPQVEFRQMTLPNEFPAAETFDLVVLSEVGYYWAMPDLEQVTNHLLAALQPGGHLLLVHWTPPVHDYPLTGDEVHDFFLAKTGPDGPLKHLHGHRAAQYRLDLLART
ncbi:methyltransferase domain-containing protein [Hymenobacter sp. BT186]|uniref:Methyltransferase domain-containing protein n=1 Tax=Hymenobacter telluris TaxID=2816474 RepID=A0A939ETX9_9BACT|nr:SAM-dependent methyltransferase [Hymenobacter telluris]MBO0357749.1 methyltransferase domain-containing protein [Hymenobacter telluris]MBW3373776.1 nodulation S family protein [Hymenobacter norwichensis]